MREVRPLTIGSDPVRRARVKEFPLEDHCILLVVILFALSAVAPCDGRSRWAHSDSSWHITATAARSLCIQKILTASQSIPTGKQAICSWIPAHQRRSFIGRAWANWTDRDRNGTSGAFGKGREHFGLTTIHSLTMGNYTLEYAVAVASDNDKGRNLSFRQQRRTFWSAGDDTLRRCSRSWKSSALR